MPAHEREEQLRFYAVSAAWRLVRAGENLAKRQVSRGPALGNVPAWVGTDDLDFHGTLAAAWLWCRAQALAGVTQFAQPIAAAWAFAEAHWAHFIPTALGAGATDEAAYDCALVLRAWTAAPQGLALKGRPLADVAARLLVVHLGDLNDGHGRGFGDPGFLAWTLLDYAKAAGDRGLLAGGRRFVERAYGMKAPVPFASEPPAEEALFDFSSTTATRILAVLAAEGSTPFVGAWLRERIGSMVPRGLVPRAQDEHTWNACVAIALGQAFLVATDGVFFDAHARVIETLAAQANATEGALGRAPGFPAETQATFYFGLALDALIK